MANSTWNALAFLVSVGLNLLILPFVVRHLGVASFGIAGLVIASIAPALIFSGSLATMATREFAQRLALAARSEAHRFFAAALFLALAAGAPIAALLWIAGPALAQRVFHLSDQLSSDLFAAFSFGAVGWLCQCVAGIFLALFTARQDYARLAAINMSGTVVSTLAMLVLIPRWPLASTFLACQTGGFAAVLIISVTLSRLSLAEWLAFPRPYVDPINQLLRIGKWQAVAQGGGLVAGQSDRYLLGAFLEPQHVGFYSIAQRLEEAVYIGVLKVGEILFPFFSSLRGEADERIGQLFFRASWVLNVLAVSLLGALIPAAGGLLHLWTGAEVAIEAQRVLIVLALAGILGSGTNVFTYFLLANGKTGMNAVISLVTALLTLLTGAIALPNVGWPAAGWSSLVGALAQMAVMTVLIRRSFNLARIWLYILHFVLIPLGMGITVSGLLWFWVGNYHPYETAIWWQVLLLYAFSAATIFAAVAAVSSVGFYGEVRRQDMYRIAMQFLPVRSS